MNFFKDHTFVICAYKESPFLEECITTIKNQTVKSNIIMTTSTPNSHIQGLSEKYNITLYVNDGENGIGQDWNFGISKANTNYVTIVHQDDIYDEEYLKEITDVLNKGKDFVITFTRYMEIKNEEVLDLTANLRIKEVLLLPLILFRNSKFAKKFALAFGCSICCPSVTLNTKIVGKSPYKTSMKSNLDWDTWNDLTKYKGSYFYIHKRLMFHRIHNDSATSNLIGSNIRLQEDLEMFNKFWPKPIAKFIMRFYKKAVKTNN